jgi:glucosylceramidase
MEAKNVIGKLYYSNVIAQFVQEELQFTKRSNLMDNNNALKVFPTHSKQSVYGFGSSFTEATGYVFNQMSEKTKTELLNLYFSKDHSGYNLARMPIQSCDFSLGNYSYVQTEEELLNEQYDFSHDEKNVIPFIKAALKINPEIVFMASPWSPPAFMKTNNDMNGGGYLKKEYYPAWAKIIHAYLDFYLSHGIKIQKFSVQNEPVMIKQWDSCLYENFDEADFAVNYLKKELKNTPHEEIELYIWDHDKDGLIEWVDETFRHPQFREAIAGIAFHWYSGDHFEQVQYIAEKYPEKDLLFTEGCVPQEGFSSHVEINHGNIYIHDLIHNFKNGTTGYIDWNILLDSTGGPNHMGNTCEAPIMYDVAEDRLQVNLSYHYIKHFSHFVASGAKVIYSSVYDSTIDQVAFVNSDGQRVLIAFNNSEVAKSFRVIEGEFEVEITLEKKQVVTLVWE